MRSRRRKGEKICPYCIRFPHPMFHNVFQWYTLLETPHGPSPPIGVERQGGGGGICNRNQSGATWNDKLGIIGGDWEQSNHSIHSCNRVQM